MHFLAVKELDSDGNIVQHTTYCNSVYTEDGPLEGYGAYWYLDGERFFKEHTRDELVKIFSNVVWEDKPIPKEMYPFKEGQLITNSVLGDDLVLLMVHGNFKAVAKAINHEIKTTNPFRPCAIQKIDGIDKIVLIDFKDYSSLDGWDLEFEDGYIFNLVTDTLEVCKKVKDENGNVAVTIEKVVLRGLIE